MTVPSCYSSFSAKKVTLYNHKKCRLAFLCRYKLVIVLSIFTAVARKVASNFNFLPQARSHPVCEGFIYPTCPNEGKR